MAPEIVALASNVAMSAHAGQKRKYTGAPYWTHCLAVATQVELWGGTPEMVAAAYLHDTIEDTDVTEARLYKIFGPVVTGLVVELTDEFTKEKYPLMNRAQRKEAEADRIGRLSLEARVIKLADMQDNTSTIELHDPGFAKVYLAEKARVYSLIGNSLNEWRTRNEAHAS